MAEKKDWFQKGYGPEAQAMKEKESLSFAGEKKQKKEGGAVRPLRKAAEYKLWQPREFYLSKPVNKDKDGNESKVQNPTNKISKSIIFTDDGGVVRRHLGYVKNDFFKSGGSWQLISCSGAAGPLNVYESLTAYKGYDEAGTPGLFPSCCGKHFAAEAKTTGKPRPGMTDAYHYRTVIVVDEWTDKNDVRHAYEPQLLGAKGIAQGKLDDKASRAGGSLAGRKYVTTRYNTKTSNNVGDDFDFEKKGDLLKLVPYMTYCGLPLAQLMVESWDDPGLKEALGEIFEIPAERPETGYWVPVFNYASVLAPWSEEMLQEAFGDKKQVSAQPVRTYAPPVMTTKVLPGFEDSGDADEPAEDKAVEEDDDKIPF